MEICKDMLVQIGLLAREEDFTLDAVRGWLKKIAQHPSMEEIIKVV